MEITITINDEQFQQLAKDTISSLTEEQKINICKEGIIKLLSDPVNIETIMSSRYDYTGKSGTAKLLEKAAESINFSEVYTDVKEEIIEYLKAHREELPKLFIQDLFFRGLTSELYYREDFKDLLRRELYAITNH